MVTWFCPACHAMVSRDADRCPSCGADLAALDAEGIEAKLIRALRHVLPDRRVLAARALGRRRAVAALAVLAGIAESDPDPYVAAAAVTALAEIGGDRAEALVERIAATGRAVPRAAARAALDRRAGSAAQQEVDRRPGRGATGT
jgi:hypothetical protein